MAIKASGFCLGQITPDQAYAVLDYAALRRFYHETDPAGLTDIEQAGSAAAKAAISPIEGLAPLRPSVEAGFHALLEPLVLHTHAVYANLATCSAEGEAVAVQALASLDEPFVFVPYINPGTQLTFAVRQAVQQVAVQTGRRPRILFLQNHGLVITDQDAQACLDLHDTVNRLIGAAYGVSTADWPKIAVRARQSATPWLRDRLRRGDWDLDLFMTRALYPDQLVFLGGQLGVVNQGSLTDSQTGQLADKCTIFRQTGEVYYQCGDAEAQTMEETLCAVLFITDTIARTGRTVRIMSEAGRSFISNWESEQYRKTVTAGQP
jgi:rhamnose utilization protein RhaD (predicted bifunctional aldolase and dehydrogenase)